MDRSSQAPAAVRRHDARQPAWTIEDACAWFAEGGIPADPAGLERIIRELRKMSGGRAWAPVGEARAGPQGGRGKALYPVRDLMLLHAGLAPWIAPPADPGPAAP